MAAMGDHQYTLADLEDSYSPREFAALAHVSQRTVLRWIAEGRLDAVHITSRVIRIPKRAAEAWFAAAATTSPDGHEDWPADLTSDVQAKTAKRKADRIEAKARRAATFPVPA